MSSPCCVKAINFTLAKQHHVKILNTITQKSIRQRAEKVYIFEKAIVLAFQKRQNHFHKYY